MGNYYALMEPPYKPAMRNILSITQANPCVITTTYDGINPGNHDYITGTILRLYVPNNFGMVQANWVIGTITVLNATQFSFPLDTTYFDVFAAPAVAAFTPAQCVAIGEDAHILTAAFMNVLPYS